MLDYINGAYYWFFVSILTIVGILAPSIFLMFRVFFLSINQYSIWSCISRYSYSH